MSRLLHNFHIDAYRGTTDSVKLTLPSSAVVVQTMLACKRHSIPVLGELPPTGAIAELEWIGGQECKYVPPGCTNVQIGEVVVAESSVELARCRDDPLSGSDRFRVDGLAGAKL
jgi:hypothetical protein